MGRYDLSDFEWSVIEPLMPMDRRGPKPKNNRQIINGMFYILRTGSPWRDLPERYGPYTSVYNRFNRWRKAGIWDKLMDAIVKAHDGKVQMIDSSIVRVHQHASGVKKRGSSTNRVGVIRAAERSECGLILMAERRPPCRAAVKDAHSRAPWGLVLEGRRT